MTIATLPVIDIPADSPGTGVRFATAAPSLWRVIDTHGRIVGHLQAVLSPEGVRFRALRFHAASRAFRDLGAFWRAQDAVDCLRFAR